MSDPYRTSPIRIELSEGEAEWLGGILSCLVNLKALTVNLEAAFGILRKLSEAVERSGVKKGT